MSGFAKPGTARRAAILLLVALLSWPNLAPAPAAAADCVVTSTADSGAGTLRAALANSDGFAGCNLIGFADGLGEIAVAQRLLIDRPVTVEGPPAGSQIVRYTGGYSADGSVVQITGGPVTLRGLTIQDGKAAGVWGGGIHILNATTPLDVTIERVTVQNNVSTTGGGGIYISNGTLLLRNSIVSGNVADPFKVDPGFGGGGLFVGNEFGQASATIDGGSQFLGNSATKNNDGGAIHAYRKDGSLVAPPQLTIADSTIGSVAQPNVVGTSAGGGGLANNGTATLTNVAIIGNKAGAGGGIINAGLLTLAGVTLGENRAAYYGGGLFNEVTATISNSTIANNRAYGTGIGQGTGGGIANSGTLTLTNSTISGNLATSLGGGLSNDRSHVVSTLTNVTISGNEAYGSGGGLANYFGTLTLINATVVGNAAAHGAGLWNYTVNSLAGTATTLQGSIVASNGTEDCGTTDPVLAPLSSQGHNVVGNGTGCPLSGTDLALVGPLNTLLDPALADNGGPTQTHTLVAGSPALDLAPAPCAATADQRGVARPQGVACDSGAFELGAAPPTPSPSPSPAQSPSPSATPAPSASATPAPSAIPIPSPSPATHILKVSAGAGGDASGGGLFAHGAVATATAMPALGQVFLGWTFDGGGTGHLPGAPNGWSPVVSVTMDADHTLVAAFAPIPAFGDAGAFGPDRPAIDALTARAIIRGYQPEVCAARGVPPPCFGPGDHLVRAQMAALIVRALGWGADDPGPAPFSDLGAVDPELARAVGILAARGVVQGYGDGTYGPTDEVLAIQVVAFVARAMVARGYWVAATGDDPALFPDVLPGSGHRLDLVAFVRNAGAPPGHPLGSAWADWDQPAARGWMASVLWQALDAHFGRDELARGGYIP